MTQMTRRALLAGAGSLPALSLPHTAAYSSVKQGSYQVDTLSDGYLTLPGEFVFAPMPKDELAPLLEEQNVKLERLTPECNLTLLRSDEHKVLFDCGSGPDFMPTAGKILDSFEALGLAPEDITHVVLTHAHPDHIWGLLDDFDDPLFYEADYLIGQDEWAYWTDPETVETIGEARTTFAVGAARRLAAIEDRISLFSGGDEILPGVAAVASYGHTPGHMAFEVRGGGSESLMIVGDAIGNHHVAFARPGWPSGSDQDAQSAIKARQMLLERIAAEKMQMVGFHFPNGGVGRTEKTDDGYRFIPADA